MLSIYDYLNYRLYLRDRFEESKRKNPLFSYQSFSRLAGAKSTSFLKLVIDGQRNLADEGIVMVAKGFKLSDAERDYLEALVKFNQAKSNEEKDLRFRKLTANRRFLAAKPLTSAQYKLFSHWYYVAILELVRLPTPTPKKARWIQKHLHPEVPLAEVKQAIQNLKRSGLLAQTQGGGLIRKEAMLTSDDEIRSLALVQFHSQVSQLAARAVREEPAAEREFSSLTFLASEASFRRAKEEIQKFRRKLHSILEQEGEGTPRFVGQVNLQLFKLSKMESNR